MGWLPLLSVAIMILMGSCNGARNVVEVPDVRIVRDTIWQHTHQVDSLVVRDSVHIDGERIYKERIIYKTRTLADTVYLVRNDTVRVPKVVERTVAAPVPWYDKASMYVGRMCLLSALFWILFFYLKRKL